MANKQINQLPEAEEVSRAFRFPIQDEEGVTQNVSVDQLVNFTSRSIQYNNVAFVNPFYTGGAGELNNIFKPFYSVAEAQASLVNDPGTPGVVVLTKCIYQEEIKLQDNTVYYCEPGVVFVNGGFTDKFSDVDISCKVLGYAAFTGGSVPLFIIKNTNLIFEFDYIDNILYALLIAGSDCNVNVYGNSIRSQAANGFCITIRNKSYSNIYIKSHIITHTYSAVFYRAVDGIPYSGKSYIQCPVIEGRSLADEAKVIWSDVTSTEDSSIRIDGDVICTTTDTNTYYAAAIVFSYGKFVLNGNIDCSTVALKALSTSHYGQLSEDKLCLFEINGNITAQNECVYINWQPAGGNYRITVNGNLFSGKGIAIVTNNNNKLVLNNAHVVSAAENSTLIKVDPEPVESKDNHHLYAFNCLFYSPGDMGFCVDTNSDIGVSFHNVRSNKNIPNSVTDLLSPTGFIHDVNFVIPMLQ